MKSETYQVIPSHLSKIPLGSGCQHSSGQQAKLYPRAWTRRLMGPVPSCLLHPSAKPFLLIALALAFPRQLPHRAHDQHLHQLYTLPLFSDLLGCAPACSINPSLWDGAIHEIPELSKSSPSHPQPLHAMFPPCALHREGGQHSGHQTLMSEANLIFFLFPRTAAHISGFPPPPNKLINTIAFLQALLRSSATRSQPCCMPPPLCRAACVYNVHPKQCPSARLLGTALSSSSHALQRSTSPSVPEIEKQI